VYASYSAGADMLTPSLDGIELVDDPDDVPPGYDAAAVVGCLGVVPYHLALHHGSDHPDARHEDDVVRHYINHHMPFVALRDGEALVRDGDRELVVG
jgi:dipeptidase E